MRGLASSRHAPRPGQRFPGRQHSSTAPTVFPPPDLTVTPAAPLAGSVTDADLNTARSPLSSHDGNTTAPSLLRQHPPQPHRQQLPISSPPCPTTRPAHELARYTKIIRRLQWKLPFLAQGYRLATTTTTTTTAEAAEAVAEAELMFKLDFFEYYMLLERALVHLLGVFGVVVPRGNSAGGTLDAVFEGGGGGGHGHGVGGEEQQQKPVLGLAASVWSHDGPRRHAARHRYHANVLAALDREDSPLRGTLGTGEVRRQLGRAKDLRNRWKTAGEEEDGEGDGHVHRGHDTNHDRSPARSARSSPERQWRTKKVSAPLETYRLEHMLEVIFAGLDEAFKVAERFVRDGAEPGALGDTDMLDLAAAADDEDQWEFMVEAMDWEAV